MSDSTAEEAPPRIAPFVLGGRTVLVREMTNGQKLALAMALELAKKRPGMAMIRVWAVIEATMSEQDWDYVDDGFLSGALSMNEMLGFVAAIAGHDWDEADDAPGAAESVA